MLESARDEAIVKQQPVAMALLTSNTDARKVFVALEYVPATDTAAATWKQISRWEPLPSGIVVAATSATDSSLADAFVSNKSPTVATALPKLQYHGTSYNTPGDYEYLIFMPDGSLYKAAKSYSVSLVEGTWSGSDVQRTGSASNSLQIVINDATGRVKVVRP